MTGLFEQNLASDEHVVATHDASAAQFGVDLFDVIEEPTQSFGLSARYC
jgi:hypothetical protein